MCIMYLIESLLGAILDLLHDHLRSDCSLVDYK